MTTTIYPTYPDFSKMDFVGEAPHYFTLEEITKAKSDHPHNLTRIILRTNEWIKQNVNVEVHKKQLEKIEEQEKKIEKLVEHRDSWRLSYANQEKIAHEGELEIAKLKESCKFYNKELSFVVDENEKLKEENEKLKEELKVLKEFELNRILDASMCEIDEPLLLL